MKQPFKPGEKVSYDMTALIESSPTLAPYVIMSKGDRQTIDFKDADAVRALNQAILKHYFGIEHWAIPTENLIPPIPGRAHYLYHLRALLGESQAHILDIGCGANVIYPLIGHALFKWTFTGSEIDDDSIKIAKNIIEANGLTTQINVVKQDNTNAIFEGIINEADRYTACMCNPPFFKTMEIAKEKNRDKNRGLRNDGAERNFNGKPHELTFPGGEFQFINNMIWESEKFAKQIKWFSCLISKAVHARKLEEILKRKPIREHRILEMQQGQKQSRILVWTYQV